MLSVLSLRRNIAAQADLGTHPLADDANPGDPPESLSLPGPGISIAEAEDPNRPKKAMGFRDLILFLRRHRNQPALDRHGRCRRPEFDRHLDRRVAGLLHAARPIGSRTLVPLPNEGGIYVWSKRAFGDFAGFMTAWTYWTCNLPYFPAVLYFAASNALYMRPSSWAHLSNNTTFYVVFSLLALTVATLLNILGLDIGTWLHNLGALAMWIPVGIIIGWAQWRGTATDRPPRSPFTP